MAGIHKGKEHKNRLLTYHKSKHCHKQFKTQIRTLKLFNLVNNLTSSKSSNPMSEGQTDSILAKEFATFFLVKLRTYMTNSQELGNLNHLLMSKYYY